MITLSSIRAKIARLTPSPTKSALTLLIDTSSGLVIDTFACEVSHCVTLHEEPVHYAPPHLDSIRSVRRALAL